MNYRIQTEPPAIFSTGAATDNATVFGSLKMARAALDDAVDRAIEATSEDYTKGVAALNRAARERIRDLRDSRRVALKVREGDLPSDTIEYQAARADGASSEGPHAEVAKEKPTGVSSGPTSLGTDPAVSGAGDDPLAIPSFLKRA